MTPRLAWRGRGVACVQGLINVFQVSSTWLTVNMALGRYFAICRPLHARGYINARGTLLTVLVIFVGSALFNVPRFCHYRAVETPCDWLLNSDANSTGGDGGGVLPDQPPDCRCVYYSKVTSPASLHLLLRPSIPRRRHRHRHPRQHPRGDRRDTVGVSCRSACHRNKFRKSRVSDVSAKIVARMSVSVSASWNGRTEKEMK